MAKKKDTSEADKAAQDGADRYHVRKAMAALSHVVAITEEEAKALTDFLKKTGKAG